MWVNKRAKLHELCSFGNFSIESINEWVRDTSQHFSLLLTSIKLIFYISCEIYIKEEEKEAS